MPSLRSVFCFRRSQERLANQATVEAQQTRTNRAGFCSRLGNAIKRCFNSPSLPVTCCALAGAFVAASAVALAFGAAPVVVIALMGAGVSMGLFALCTLPCVYSEQQETEWERGSPSPSENERNFSSSLTRQTTPPPCYDDAVINQGVPTEAPPLYRTPSPPPSYSSLFGDLKEGEVRVNEGDNSAVSERGRRPGPVFSSSNSENRGSRSWPRGINLVFGNADWMPHR